MQTIFKYDNAIIYTNIIATMEDFTIWSRINYTCIASSQSKFVLPNTAIAVNLSKYEKALYFLYKGKKVSHSSFYRDKWFLDFGASTYFTLFESDFVDMTLSDYGWVKTTNLRAPLFIVASSPVLIEHKIFDSKIKTTKVTTKLWPVYYVFGI